MLWQRYGFMIIIAVPFGAMAGAAAGYTIYLDRDAWGISDSSPIGIGTVLGAVDGVAAYFGSMLMMQWRFETVGRNATFLFHGALGACLGAAALWLVMGCILSMGGAFLALWVSLQLAIVSGILAFIVAALCIFLRNRTTRRL